MWCAYEIYISSFSSSSSLFILYTYLHLQTEYTDNAAFMLLRDAESYSRATRDDMRIFGMCIHNRNCRIQKVSWMRTLVLECKACFTAVQVKIALTKILRSKYLFHIVDCPSSESPTLHVKKSKPKTTTTTTSSESVEASTTDTSTSTSTNDADSSSQNETSKQCYLPDMT